MKNLTVNRLALGNLKHRRKQYTIMIIGIILAMVFSSSIIYLGYSLFSISQQAKYIEYGKSDAIYTNVQKEIFEDMAKQNIIDKNYGYAHTIGYMFTEDNNEMDGAYIAWLDDEAMDLANPILLSGNYPSKENEIAVESAYFSKLGITAEPGDTITVRFYDQNGKEHFGDAYEKQYVLSGILRNKKINIVKMTDPGYMPAAFVAKETKVAAGGKENLTCYFNVNNYKALDDYIYSENKKNLSLDFTNYVQISLQDVFNYGSTSFGDITYSVGFYAIIAAVLMVASCLAVINAFSSNLNQRKKQIGMLRAVGATKRQIVKMFSRETFIISLVCIPISLVVSYGITRAVVSTLGKDYAFESNIWVLALCGLFSVFVVTVAAYIPLKSASRITPIQAIRDVESNRKMKTKKIKTQRDFKVPSLLAKRSLVFSRGRQIVVTLFLIISIVASSYVGSYVSYEKDNFYHTDADYNMTLERDSMFFAVNYDSNNQGYSETAKQTMLSSPCISNCSATKQGNAIVHIDSFNDYICMATGYGYGVFDAEPEGEVPITKDNYKERLYSKFNSTYLDLQSKMHYGNYYSPSIYSFEFGDIEKIQSKVTEGEIHLGKINAGEEIVLLAPQKLGLVRETDSEGDEYTSIEDVSSSDKNKNLIVTADCPYHAGDKMDVSVLTAKKPNENYDLEGTGEFDIDIKEVHKTVTIGAIINELPDDVSIPYGSDTTINLITSTGGMNTFLPNLRYKEMYFSLNQPCTDEIDAEITALMEEVANGVNDANIVSDYAYQKDQRAERIRIFIAMFAIVILFFTICASIINNALSAGIRSNKRQIGTLRAVGASSKELTLSYIKQLLSMFKWGIILGYGVFAISFVGAYIHHIMEERKYNITYNFEFTFNPWITAALTIIMFAICALNLHSKIKNEMKNSIVENIREL